MRIALGVEYDGANFNGWQVQAQGQGRSVQGCVEQALAKVANHAVRIHCAGRTDTGVHATGQTIHFESDAVRKDRGWLHGANAHLGRSRLVMRFMRAFRRSADVIVM